MFGKLEKLQRRKFVCTTFFIFSVCSYFVDILETVSCARTSGLSPVGMLDSQYDYTIVNFVLMYFIGSYIRHEGVSLSINIPGILLCITVMWFTTNIETAYALNRITWNYNNPLVIILSVLIFLSFKDLRINSRVVNELAKGAFICYIFHVDFMLLFGIPGIGTATSSHVLVMLAHQTLVAASFYMISYVIYKVYTLFSKPILRMIAPLCDKVDLSVQQPH